MENNVNPEGMGRRSARRGGPFSAADAVAPVLPANRPLQYFLLGAFIITVLAFLTSDWSESPRYTSADQKLDKLRNLVFRNSRYVRYKQLGLVAMEKERYDDALNQFQLAQQATNSAEIHLLKGQALLKLSRPDAALGEFKTALALDGKLMAAYTAWGAALITQGKIDDAVKLYQKALAQNPASAELHYDLALAYENQKKGDDAGKEYAAANNLGYDAPDFCISYGTYLNKQRNYAVSEPLLHRAVAAKPDSPQAHFQLAEAEQNQGEYEDAISHYETMLTLAPDNPLALNGLALLYATATNQEARSPKMGILLATRANEATGNQNPRYLDTLAQCYANDTNFFEALAWEDRAVRRAAALIDRDLLREFNPRFQAYHENRVQ